MAPDRQQITDTFIQIQRDICAQLEQADGKATFREDMWDRPQGGGGRTRIIEHGDLLAKGGVNFSAVWGPVSERMYQVLHLKDYQEGITFYATGVSIVLHPNNPHVPIIHSNIRYFELSNGIWWFGGGIDLTPHYVVPEQAAQFHRHLRDTCHAHHPSYYPAFKKWADDYFYISHRKETRGVGGIFFDRLGPEDGFTKQQRWDFVKGVGEAFCSGYLPIANANRHLPYGERELLWQSLRRGRYVEFNLVLDRGTKFGLETDGRTESILMSLPPMAQWIYEFQTEPGSPEAFTLSMLDKNISWGI